MNLKKKILVIFGTRPEFIKLLPIILNFKSNKKVKLIICNSSQHKDLIRPFLKFYNINIDYDLNVLKKGQSLSYLSAQLLNKFDKVLKKTKPDCVIVQGDTSTSFIGSLTAFYNNIKVFHIEAGLRTYNIKSPWPEEINRQFISKLCDHHFAPTKIAKKNLLNEGYKLKDITLTGNTVIDLLLLTIGSIKTNYNYKGKLADKFNFLKANKFKILLSVHRRENFGNNLKEIFLAINEIAKIKDIQIIYCIHTNPEVIKAAKNHLIKRNNIRQIKSLDYMNFVYLMENIDFIMSDSGGIQEEAPSLGKPHIILREFTERPEAIDNGSAILVPLNKKKIISNFQRIFGDKKILRKMSAKRNIYGNGNASKIISKKILKIIKN